MSGKLLRQVNNLSDVKKKNLNLNNPKLGMNNFNIIEAVPKFLNAANSTVIKNNHNAFLVLGKDRPASFASGYGGAGATECASVDMVVGLQSMAPGGPRNNAFSDPNMMYDSARILISQMTDVDYNFGIVSGKQGSPKGLSAAAIKADSVRLISRSGGIKLVTGTDPKNSKGGDTYSIPGIDLLAGNDDGKRGLKAFGEIDNLQPIPKGGNLELYLEKMMNRIDALAGILSDHMKAQGKLNSLLSGHVHLCTAPGAPSAPSIELMIGTPLIGIVNTAFVKIPNYLNRLNMAVTNLNHGKKYGGINLNSRYNRTT
jgi:hypothetical protein